MGAGGQRSFLRVYWGASRGRLSQAWAFGLRECIGLFLQTAAQGKQKFTKVELDTFRERDQGRKGRAGGKRETGTPFSGVCVKNWEKKRQAACIGGGVIVFPRSRNREGHNPQKKR